MTFGGADPNSLCPMLRGNWPMASLRRPEVLRSPGAGYPGTCPPTTAPLSMAISAPG